MMFLLTFVALNYYRQALQVNPRYSPALYNIGVMYIIFNLICLFVHFLNVLCVCVCVCVRKKPSFFICITNILSIVIYFLIFMKSYFHS